MNFQKILPASAATDLRFIVLALMLSGVLYPIVDAGAQSRKKNQSKAVPEANPGRLSVSTEPDSPGALWPEWFLNPPPVPHGVGVSPFWKSDSMRSYAAARKLAIEDLNAADRLVVTVETAISQQFPMLMAHEFAIDERFNDVNTAGIDSVICDGRVYYLVAAEPIDVPKKALLPIPEKPEWAAQTGPEAQEELFDVTGQYKIFIYTKQNSWIKSKQDALSKLSQFVSLQVKANQKLYQESVTQTIYIRSRIYIQDAIINARWSDGKNYYLRLHVLKDNIKALD